MATIDAKRLRQKLLDLAVRGKLVSQDPNDEPASALLERIREERHKLIKEGKIKAPKGGESVIYRGSDGSHYEKRIDTKGHESEPVCIDDEIPFEIPASWEWARLGSVTTYIQRGKSPKYSKIEKYPVISQKCNQWAGFSIDRAKFVDPSTVTSYMNERIIQNGDLLWNSTGLGTLGRMAIYDSNKNKFGWAVADSHVTVIRTNPTWFNYRFAFLYFASPVVQTVIEEKASGSTQQKELLLSTATNYLVPLPPLEEQSRIVTALDKYLELVNDIENNSVELEKLYDVLRAKVLDLAIRGKLVPQDPNDEPASVLLERIREKRHELIKEGKIKAPKGGESVIYRGSDGGYYEKRIDTKGHDSEPVCIDDEIPFEIPDSWEWARLGSFSNYGDASSAPAEQINDGSWILDLEDIEKSTGRILTRKTKSERFSLSTKRPFKKGQLLYSKLRPYLNKVLVADSDGFCTSEIMPISLHGSVCPNYIRYCMMSNYFLDYANQCAYGCKMPRLGANDGKKALIPLPSLEEQSRIVAKVEQVFQIM